MFKEVSTDLNFAQDELKWVEFWDKNNILDKSIIARSTGPAYVFYEGPPTANGKPHIGHLMTRVTKDLFPKYKTMCGCRVLRKAGWDTHGLPVEIEVEKVLGLKHKAEIEKFGIDNFVKKCKESVFTYKKEWENLLKRCGFWQDMQHPYVTYTNDYIESIWWALKQFWLKGLLYEGHKIVPYCSRCGTALSSHELSQGYKEVAEEAIFVKLPLINEANTYFLVWTTTPWTLPSNVAIAVNSEYDYALVEVNNEKLILAKDLIEQVIGPDYKIIKILKGKDLIGSQYKPLFDFLKTDKKVFYVVAADFVTLTDGSGIVHIAPAFGEDDYKVGKENDLPVFQPVDSEGLFTDVVYLWKSLFVKDADPKIMKNLEERGLLFKRQIYKHDYPFCWRCDTPLIYRARHSWFLKVTAIKDKIIECNNTVNWYPEHIKTGRFGDFLNNLIDWALSRQRYWGTPLNIWKCQKCFKDHCVESMQELKAMAQTPVEKDLELHKPWIDNVVLTCPHCKDKMLRVPDVIDCWFDSGSMPFSQWHYPFENKDNFKENFPADFISEAQDQTRGWFYTLLVINSFLFDKAPYKNVIVTGLGLDKDGFKMSKSKNNVLDPWILLNNQGADAVRWYLYSQPPWNSRRFYPEAIIETQRKFLGTLKNVYSFFVLYANIDNFNPLNHKLELSHGQVQDRWIMSRLQTVIENVRKCLDNYDISPATKELDQFIDDLSNWFVRLSRKRFWESGMTDNKITGYMVLYELLVTTAKLLAPFVPFITEDIYQNLVCSINPQAQESVHLCDYPVAKKELIDCNLELVMSQVRDVVSLARACRSKSQIKVRQPLSEIMVKVNSGKVLDFKAYEKLIFTELNIKKIRFIDNLEDYLEYKKIEIKKPLFDKKEEIIKAIREKLNKEDVYDKLRQAQDTQEKTYSLDIEIGGVNYILTPANSKLEIAAKDGFCLEASDQFKVLLNMQIDDNLKQEGYVRELVNKIQFMRKETGFEVIDRIELFIESSKDIMQAIKEYENYIKKETLTVNLFAQSFSDMTIKEWNINGVKTIIGLRKIVVK